MSRVIQATDADGKAITQTNSYTELATGLHYLQDGKLVESKAEITLLPQGGAAATQGQHKAYFPPNLNGGVIDLVMPDGRELKSQIRGLGYYDKATGKNVILAEVRDTEGTLYPPNVIVYENAFNGLHADVRYTYRRSGFEQDVILREQPPTPKELGLAPDTTRLEVLTEFIESPTPAKRTVGLESKASDADQSLYFGAMTMVRGRAFSTGEPSRTNRPVAVSKSWEQIEGRPFLIEQVDYNQIAPKLNSLPKTPHGASITNPGKSSKIGRLASGRQLPARNIASKKNKSLQLAKAKEASRPGFLLDYPIQLHPTENNFTFAQGQTYYVVGDGPGGAILTGTTTIENGAVIKSRFDDPYQGYDQYVLLLEDTTTTTASLVCSTIPDRPAIFTDWCDDSVGDVISGSTGYPYASYPYVIAANAGAVSFWQYKNLKFLQGEPSIFVGNTANTSVVTVQNCQFIGNTVYGVVAQLVDGGNLILKNDLFSVEDTAVTIIGNNVAFSAQNITAERFSTFVTGAGSVAIKDSLFVGGGWVAGTPTYTSFPSSASGLFQTGPLGAYYLNPSTSYVIANLIDHGSQSPTAADLSGFTTRVDETPDTGLVDRGFHYASRVLQLSVACNSGDPTSIGLTWTLPAWLEQVASSYIHDFKIYRCASSSGSCNPISLYKTITDPNARTYTDTGAGPGKTYCYRITWRYAQWNGQYYGFVESPPSLTQCSSACCPAGNAFWVDQRVEPQQMAEWIMAGSGITVVPNSAAFSGIDPKMRGIFGKGGNANLEIEHGVILCTGDIGLAHGPNENTGGPAVPPSPGSLNGSDNGDSVGDSNLNSLVSGLETRDAAVLTFDVSAPENNTPIEFKYIFASEEYHYYIGPFNDIMAIWVDGDNIAVVPGSSPPVPIAVNNIHNGFAPHSIAAKNPTLFVDNETSLPGPFNIQYNGYTHLLTTIGKTLSNVGTHHIKIAIADATDQVLDSAVFIKASTPCP